MGLQDYRQTKESMMTLFTVVVISMLEPIPAVPSLRMTTGCYNETNTATMGSGWVQHLAVMVRDWEANRNLHYCPVGGGSPGKFFRKFPPDA
jgi:hypothetical protein